MGCVSSYGVAALDSLYANVSAGKVSFLNVVTFNMDEYVGLPRNHPESYWSFMHNNFFNHIDIKEENINILNGNTANHDEECQRYEEKVISIPIVVPFYTHSSCSSRLRAMARSTFSWVVSVTMAILPSMSQGHLWHQRLESKL